MNDVKIGAYVATSFIDWTTRVCAVLFCCGCNLRCPWCHNGELATNSLAPLDLESVFADIESHKNFLAGLVVSGGEACMSRGIVDFLSALRDRFALPIKLDTNGTYPDTLEKILLSGLVECVALDVKAPLDDGAYARLCGVRVDMDAIRRSLALAKRFPAYELRTTWVPDMLAEEDMLAIWRDIGRDPHWVVQPFVPDNALDENLRASPRTSPLSLESLREKIPSLHTRA